MDAKPLFRIGVFAALAVICGLCALTAYGTYDWLTGTVPLWDVWEGGDNSGQVTENYTYAAVPNLVISTDAGDVSVEAADVTEIEVEVVKSSWGRTDEEAEAAAAALNFRAVMSADGLTLTFEQPDEFGFGWKPGPDSIDFIVRVPAETSVDLRTSFGKITVSGLTGDAHLENDFGEIEVVDLNGALEAGSSSASVTVRRVDAGEGDVTVGTSFGEIVLEDVRAGSVSVGSTNGPITVDAVTAVEAVVVENQFGSIDVTDINAASVTITNDNGRIVLEGGQVGGLVKVTNQFGEVKVTGLEAAAYELTGSNGDIVVEDAAGSLVLETSFGDITVRAAAAATLDLRTSNGNIRFTGPLADAAHSITNAFGDITLTIPGDSAFDLLLETDFGEIRSDIPLSLTGQLDSGGESNRWEAAINGGGPLLEASTSNGDVVIEILPDAAGG